MKRTHSSGWVIMILLAFTACARHVDSSTPPPPQAPGAAATPIRPAPTIDSEISQIAALAKGRVGVAAMILESGETVVSFGASDHFPTQSVYKLPISMAVIARSDAGKLKLDQKIKINKEDYVGRNAHSPIRDKYPNGTELAVTELLQFALSESDGTASDVLMKLAGGPVAVQAYVSQLGIQDWKIVDTEKGFAQDSSLQFRNWATPDAAVALLRALHERRGLSASGQQLILKYMLESTPGANRLKGLLPAGTAVAHKTG